VQDKGIGLTEAEQANLFEPFSRLKRSDDRVVPGTGLGLASCRSVAELLGGSVGVRSRLNHGSVFYLRVPLIAADQVIAAPEPIYRGTVLLVEDTNYNAWAAEAVLRRFGLTCDRARTGAEALAMFEQKGYGVVLLDRNLPDLDGTEVAKRIRRLEAGASHAVLLAVTAYSSEEDRALCLASGMDAFIGKPLTPENVRAALASLGAPLMATSSVQMGSDRSPPGSVVDLSLLAFLAEEDAAGLGDQVTRWFGQIDQTMAAIGTAIRAADFATLRTASHELLGHARVVGAGELSEVIQEMEACTSPGQATLLLSRLATVVRQTKESVTSAAASRLAGPRPSAQPS
jgi:CheY-like chemotaxis protein